MWYVLPAVGIDRSESNELWLLSNETKYWSVMEYLGREATCDNISCAYGMVDSPMSTSFWEERQEIM